MLLIKKYKIKIILISLVVTICSLAAYFPSLVSNNSSNKYIIPKIDFNKKYQVSSVIDGDTFEVNIDKKIVRIRMIGIDTPETVDPRKPVQCFGKEASDKSKELLLGHSVTLQTDKSQSILDKYGRVLSYVYLHDSFSGNSSNISTSSIFMNEFLLKEGYAREYTYNKAYKMQKEFKKIQKDAIKDKRGLWGICEKI